MKHISIRRSKEVSIAKTSTRTGVKITISDAKRGGKEASRSAQGQRPSTLWCDGLTLFQVIINVTRVQLDEDTRRIYNSVEALSRQRFMAMANAAQDGEHVPNVVLSLLTRMRYVAARFNNVFVNVREQANCASPWLGSCRLPGYAQGG